MKNILVSLVIAGALVAAPLAASAQSTDIQSQISALLAEVKTLQLKIADLLHIQSSLTTTTSVESSSSQAYPHRICTTLVRNLTWGARGDDVTSLQEYLNERGYFSASATGFFGPMTTRAVAKWQVSQGVSSVGSIGPMSRERIKVWCGNPVPPICKPINYMPIACSDGSQPQSVQDSHGCTVRHECPVANFTPPANCKAWNDGCNLCSRTSPDAPAMCTQRACFAAGKGYCTVYFDNTSLSNKSPVISSVSGPTMLAMNQAGRWSIQAADPENGTLTYRVTWGDESTPYAGSPVSNMMTVFVQTGTFTHSYSSAGTYTVTFVVQDSAGASAQSALTVTVASSGVICTAEYAPVCGQPPEPACRHATPACMIATQGPTTYSNRCTMNAAGATFLYQGVCSIVY